MTNVDQFLRDNNEYAQNFGEKGSLSIIPARRLAVVTCMDARMDPAPALGIKQGDAHVIRNAGGAAKEAFRSLIISQELAGTNEIAIIHHTDCGMLTFDNDKLRQMLKKSRPQANETAIDKIDFLPFPDLEQSVRDDVAYLEHNELIKKENVISGWVYDVKTGMIKRII